MESKLPIKMVGIDHNKASIEYRERFSFTEKPLGSYSARRSLQLRKLFPDYSTAGVRRNVLTGLYYIEAADDYITGRITGGRREGESLGRKLALQLKAEV